MGWSNRLVFNEVATAVVFRVQSQRLMQLSVLFFFVERAAVRMSRPC